MNCTHRASGINLSRYDDQPEVAGGFRRLGQATAGRGTSNKSQTLRSAPCLRIIRHHPITTRSVITEISNLGDVLTRIWFRILQQKLKKTATLTAKLQEILLLNFVPDAVLPLNVSAVKL